MGLGRIAPAGSATRGTLGQDGRRFDRLGWFNALDFGATGGGSVDDRASINAALNAASAAGGGVVFLPTGTYLVSATVAIPSNTTLIGAGIGATTIKAMASMGDDSVVQNADQANGNDDITVEGVTIHGNFAGRGAIMTGHVLNIGTGAASATRCRRITVRNVRVTDAPLASMVMVNCVGLVIEGCQVDDSQRDGIAVYYNSSGVRIIDNFLTECGDDYIAVNGELSGSTGHSITDVAITGNVCGPSQTLSANQGIVVRSGERIAISGNTVFQGSAAGIQIGSQNTSRLRDVTVSGNTIVETGDIPTAGGQGILVQNAEFSAAGQAPIENVAIVGNVISRSQGDAIELASIDGSAIRDLTIANNVLRGWGDSGGSAGARGIDLSPSAGTIERIAISGNVVSDMGGAGIRATPSGSGVVRRLTVVGNQCWSNGQQTASQAGLHFGGANVSDLIILGNRSGDAPAAEQSIGLTLASVTGYTLVSNNNFVGNAAQGVSLSNLPATTWFEGNQGHGVFNLASAATVTAIAAVMQVTGTTTITSINSGPAGTRLTLLFNTTVQVTDGGNLHLSGNFSATAGGGTDSLTLISDGANWIEVSRSLN